MAKNLLENPQRSSDQANLNSARLLIPIIGTTGAIVTVALTIRRSQPSFCLDHEVLKMIGPPMVCDRRGDIDFGKEFMPHKSTRHRRAASAVEFAIVLPLVMMLIFGGIELGRAVMVQHVLDEVARGASRMYAVTTELTQSDVDDYIATAMTEADLAAYTVTYDPPSANTVEHLDPMQVTVTVNYSDVAILPAPWFMSGKQLAGTCIMPADTGALPEASDPKPDPVSNPDPTP